MGNAFYHRSDLKKWYTAHDFKMQANDDTASIQRALDVAAANKIITKKVVIPPGMYLHSTLILPNGVLLTGVGAITESLNVATSKLVMKAGGGDGIRVTDSAVDHGDITRRFWYGGITNLEFLGEPTNKKGWAISFSDFDAGDEDQDPKHHVIAPQDMNLFENLQMRGYPEGGINFPDCAVPLNVRNIKASVLGGPAIYLGNIRSSDGQSINLDNVSVDHNVGGGIWIDQFDNKTNVVITNLKSEAGMNTAFPGQPNAQPNAIICTDCDGTPIFLNGANHQNTASDVGTFKGNPGLALTEPTGDFDSLGHANYYIGVHLPGHGFGAGDKVKFTTSDTLPSVIGWSAILYVVTVDDDNFRVAKTAGGSPLFMTAENFAESGTHSLYYGFDTKYMMPGDLISIETKLTNSPVFTIGSADISLTGSTLAAGDTIKYYTSGTLPGNITAGQVYYVLSTSAVAGTFRIATTLSGTPVAVVPAGTQAGTHTIYQQVNSGKLPSLSFVASAIRVREGDHGAIPLMIAKTGIPATVSEGKLNVTQQLYKSKVTLLPSSSLTTPVNLAQGTQPVAPQTGDFWYDGTYLRFATGATTIKTLATMIDEPEKPYTGTITWSPPVSPAPPQTATVFPPSGSTSHSYQWTQVGKMVTVRFNLSYQTAGAGQNVCTLTFPADLPAPSFPAGFTTGHTLYTGSAGALTSLGSGTGTARCVIHSGGTNANRLDIYLATVSPVAVLATITYWAA